MTVAESYTLGECIYEGPRCTVLRATDHRDGSTVVLKQTSRREDADKLRHEHEILMGLDMDGVVKTRGLFEQGGMLSLVLSVFEGETLAARLERHSLDLRAALQIAIDVSQTLGRIHSRHVIHKDINPSNILVDDALRTQIIDFGLATRLPREIPNIKNPNVIEGTLPYISPEQTGRMNRAVDYRTDLYSLGATLYRMLAGRDPFVATDPLELIHCHMAKNPLPPAEVDPEVPEAVSNIVMKLLAKAAEDRYQSAFGLRRDLAQCLDSLERDGRIAPFPLGARDLSGHFQIPQKLYGREAEITALESAFLRVCDGGSQILLVTGPSGAGKSAVVRELYKMLGRKHGLFISGKFDELKRDIPYSAVLQAFDELIQYLLAESDDGIAAWKREIQSAVGTAGQVLVDVLPRLGIILGEQAPVIELPPAGARNRFHGVFQSFVGVFARKDHPLVLFVDDLQWADRASLNLFTSLLTDPSVGGLLVIGSYRDNEVSASHPLMEALAQIESAGCPRTHVEMGPLAIQSIHDLVTDTLVQEREMTFPLAELVWKKTHGNAFFAGQFLIALYKQGLIDFDAQKLVWTWDAARIASAPSTDNVIELMASRVRTLKPRTLEMLEIAACMGSRFEPHVLSRVSECSVDDLAALLADVVEEGFVIFSGTSYRFLHDRIRQAVYTSIVNDRRIDVHYKIGRLLLRDRTEADSDEKLFDLVHHLNIAMDRVTSPEERSELARLNLSAGRRARATAAFDAAAGYFAAGIGFLPSGPSVTHDEIVYALHLGRFECEFMSGRHENAERLFDSLLREARSDIQKAQAYESRLTLYSTAGKLEQAIATLVEALGLLGVDVPAKPGGGAVLVELVKTKRALAGRSPDTLLNLPEMTDLRKTIALRMMLDAVTAAFQVNQNLTAILMLRAAALSARHGSSSASAIGYMYYALIIGSMLRDFQKREQFGKLALALVERYPDKSTEATVKVGYGAFIQPWRSSLRSGFPYMTTGAQILLELGEHSIAATTMSNALINRWTAGCHLDDLLEINNNCLMFMQKTKNVAAIYTHTLLCRHFLSLKVPADDTGDPDTRDDGDAVEMENAPSMTSRHIYWLTRMQKLYIFGRNDAALADCRRAWKNDVDKAIGVMVCIVDYYFYSSLIHAVVVESGNILDRQRALWTIRRNQGKLKKWAENAPENFSQKHSLVAAELARIAKDDLAAIQGYEEAIRSAKKNEFLQDEAIALELAGKFFLSRGLADAGNLYLARARDAYERWGAHAKVSLLDEVHPGLYRADAAAKKSTGKSMPMTMTSTIGAGALDAPTMIKASQALSSEINFDKLLGRLMSVVTESAGAERGVLLLKHDGDLRVEAEISPRSGVRILPNFEPHEGSQELCASIVNYVSRTHERVILSDAANEGAFSRDSYIVEHHVKAVLCMPVMQQGDMKGILYLENNLAPGAFTEQRVELLSVLCAQMAISIENARLYAGLEQIVAERSRELEKAQARLVKLEKDATEVQMAGGFAHEMRNALVGAKVFVRNLYTEQNNSVCAENSDKLHLLYLRIRNHVPTDELPFVATILREVNSNEQKIDDALRHIGGALGRALEITHMILEYSRLGQELPGDAPVPIRPLVDAIIAELEADFQTRGITAVVEMDPEIEIPGKRAHFDSILKNLILNARDALADMHGETSRMIRVECLQERRRRILRISDNGIGIKVDDQGRIFDPFFSTKPATGTGLGLAVVRKLVSLYQGSIEVDSELGRGTTFEVVFPR